MQWANTFKKKVLCNLILQNSTINFFHKSNVNKTTPTVLQTKESNNLACLPKQVSWSCRLNALKV